ncbi:MAG TPA: phosphoenolpyruvate carboxykinase [Anaerolineae bacterium]|nr:phosphoenolpyruvate carboxykinase [Anaerolineae bacterium]
MSVLTEPIVAGNLLTCLTPDQLRQLARKDEIPNNWGMAVYRSRIRSRSAKFTYVVYEPTAEQEETIRQVREYLRGADVVRVERDIGQHPDNKFRVQYYVTRDHPNLAYMLSRNLFVPTDQREPDIVVVQVPEWPDLAIYVHPTDDGRVFTYVLGSDYYGEAKMGSLRAAMHIMREHRHGLGLHAGAKVYRIKRGNEVREIGTLIFGLSGTGKTTITVNDHGLQPPEGITILQDDIVMMTPSTYCYGTEESFYIKTDSVTSQPELYKATQVPVSIGENVWVESDGEGDFDNLTLTTNGRCIVPRFLIPHTTDSIDLPQVDVVFFNTRRYDIPPIGRLASPAQAAAFLMLGESTITSADDPTRVGESKRVVAFDPFIIDKPHVQGNRLYEILKRNPHVRVYLVNTGKVGGLERGNKIRPRDTMNAILGVLRDEIEWEFDPNLGYETAKVIPGVDMERFDPYKVYGEAKFKQLMDKLRAERQAWLAQFDGLHPDILAALG